MHPSFFKRPLFLFLILLCLFLSFFLKVPTPKNKDIFNLAPAQNIIISGAVSSFPRTKNGRQLFVIKVSAVGGKKTKGKAQVYCTDCPPVSKGQKVELTGNLKPIYSVDNFGSFDWGEYQARRHIFADIYCGGEVKIKKGSLFWGAVSGIRNSMLDVFNNNFDSPLNAVLSGITLGEKGDIPYSVYSAFQDSGAMHLLVASGSNVGFVTLIVYFLCSLIGFGRFSSAFLAVASAGFYTVTAGADPPLVRAFLMTLFATAGFLMGRKSGVLQGFVLAALVILIFNPQSFFDTGFRMSFLATLALILLIINYRLPSKLPRYIKAPLTLFFISLSAQLALLGVFTNYFHKVSLSAVFSNLLLVPLSGIIMGGGFVLWLASFSVPDFVFNGLLFALKQALSVFNFIVNFFAAMPLSKIIAPSWNWAMLSGYYLLLLTMLTAPVFWKNKFKVILTAAGCITIFLIGVFFPQKPQAHILYGHYNMAVLAKDASSVNLIGGGVDGKAVASALLSMGVKNIDCLFLASNNKSSGYVLNDLGQIKISKIYLPYGEISDGLLALIQEHKEASVNFLWQGEQACSVTAQAPWYQKADGGVFERQDSDSLSYSYGVFDTSANLKAIKKAGALYKLPASL